MTELQEVGAGGEFAYEGEFEAARGRMRDWPIKNVLVPTDFSEKSLRPLGLAVEFAASEGAALHLVHAHHPEMPPDKATGFPSEEAIRSMGWSASPDTLRERSKSAVENLTIRIETRETLDITQAILDYAQEQSIDLMVVGTAARTGLAAAFFGSVAERLVLYSKCPVLTFADDMPEHFAPPRPTILVPLDFSAPSFDCLARAAHFGDRLDALLVLLHVISPTPVPVVYGNVAMVVLETEELRPKIEAELEQIAQALPPDIRTKCLVRSGPAADVIVDVAEEVQADFIQIGSHGLTGVARHLFGSVAQKVLRTASVPVLIMKSVLDGESDAS